MSSRGEPTYIWIIFSHAPLFTSSFPSTRADSNPSYNLLLGLSFLYHWGYWKRSLPSLPVPVTIYSPTTYNDLPMPHLNFQNFALKSSPCSFWQPDLGASPEFSFLLELSSILPAFATVDLLYPLTWNLFSSRFLLFWFSYLSAYFPDLFDGPSSFPSILLFLVQSPLWLTKCANDCCPLFPAIWILRFLLFLYFFIHGC